MNNNLPVIALTVALLGCSRAPTPPPILEKPQPANNTPVQKISPKELLSKLRLSSKARVIEDPDLLTATTLKTGQVGVWRANMQILRGPGDPEIITKLAPAVVVVRGTNGFGTGVIVDPAGWILTNYHVIAPSATDPKTGAAVVTVLLGTSVEDGVMDFEPDPKSALVYKFSRESDLALLRLVAMDRKYPAIEIAQQAPKSSSNCWLIGHPQPGLLWSTRRGKIIQSGLWPRDVLHLLKHVVADPSEQQLIQGTLGKANQTKITLSNCGLNFGDSGAPLLNDEGRLVGITFALPEELATTFVAFHVHLDTVKEFVGKEWPSVPVKAAIDPLPVGAYFDLADLDGDGTPDALLIARTRDGVPTGVLLDLLQENKVHTADELLGQPRNWKFSAALHLQPVPAVYCDTRLSGTLDLVVSEVGPDKIETKRLVDKGQWKSERGAGSAWLDMQWFQDKSVQERIVRIAQRR